MPPRRKRTVPEPIQYPSATPALTLQRKRALPVRRQSERIVRRRVTSRRRRASSFRTPRLTLRPPTGVQGVGGADFGRAGCEADHYYDAECRSDLHDGETSMEHEAYWVSVMLDGREACVDLSGRPDGLPDPCSFRPGVKGRSVPLGRR